MYVFLSLLKVKSVHSNGVASYWEIATHSAYDMISYRYLVINLVFSTLVFGVGFF